MLVWFNLQSLQAWHSNARSSVSITLLFLAGLHLLLSEVGVPSGAPVFMVESASSTPLQSPPVNGRPPYVKTIGFPRAFVSSKTSSLAVPL